MKATQSSHINGTDYDPETGTLTIQFVNGAIHQYANVPANTYHTFTQSSSPGAYFHSKIKNNFSSQQVNAGQSAGKRKK